MSKMTFPQFCQAMSLPEPVPEHRFHATRKWRFDWAWIDAKVALEIEGGIWSGGRHTSPKGFLGDMAKYNAATVAGWRVIRVTPKTAATVSTAQLLKELIKP